MSLNKLVTLANQMSSDIDIPTQNDLICIDTENNRIGIGTKDPLYDLDVPNGIIKSNTQITNTLSYNTTNNKIIEFQNNHIKINKPIRNLDVSNSLNVDGSVNIINNINGNSDLNILGEFSCNNINNITELKNIFGRDISINLQGNKQLIIDGSLSIIGNGYVNGANSITSDDRLKHNEKSLINSLAVLEKLNPIEYDKTDSFKDENYYGILNVPYKKEIGFIAQDVEKIDELKHSVIQGNSVKPYYLNYNSIFVYTTAAVKELNNKLNNIHEKICELSCNNLISDNKLIILDNELKEFINSTSDKNNNETNIENLLKNITRQIENIDNRLKKIEDIL